MIKRTTNKKVGVMNLLQPGCDRLGMMGIMIFAMAAVWAVMPVNGAEAA